VRPLAAVHESGCEPSRTSRGAQSIAPELAENRHSLQARLSEEFDLLNRGDQSDDSFRNINCPASIP
jgi:hypothetical protein